MAALPPRPPRRRARPGSLERPVNGRLYRGTWLIVGIPLLIAALSVRKAEPLPTPQPLLPASFDRAGAVALASELGVPLHRVGEMAHHHCHDHEQHEIENLVRAREVVGVVGREEEIARPQHAGDRRDQRRDEAEMPAGQQHRQQEDHRAAADVQVTDQQEGDQRGRRDQHQRDEDAA